MESAIKVYETYGNLKWVECKLLPITVYTSDIIFLLKD